METKKVKYNGMVKALVALVVCLVNEKRKRFFSILKQVTNNQKRITKIVTIYAVLLTTVVTAQVYPVQVTPQLVPPYSLKLSDYQTTSSEKLFVNLLLTDVNELGRQVRLKMYIEGEGLNIQTLDFVAGANPINLDGGINQRLSNLDLRPYFNLNNLLGITPEQYNTSLPEGRYDFCFEVYDFLSGQQLSRKSCFSVYLILNEPPILNIPGNSDLVTAKNPQNIIFNWTPRHLNATNVQYEYTLKELWDTKVDPQAAFLASPALHQETTFATTLLYGPANTQLLEGKTYGWQVRALVSDGISETSVFRNDGYSEIFYFNYVGDCDTPSFIISEAESSKTVKILWQYSDHIRYEIQYRKKGYGDDDWFSAYAYNQETTIRNLEEGTVYEFRVGGECTTNGGFAFSEIHEFTTPTEEEEAYYNCGIPPEIKISNQDPLPKIGASETFTAGDFPVVVVEVSGGNGNFSGWGYITLPFLAKVNQAINLLDNATEDENGEGGTSIGKYTRIRVEFKGISINTDYQLTAGTVETSYDPNWGGILSVDDLVDYITGDEGDIATYHAENTNLADVIVNDAGNIILIDTDGNEIPIEVRKPVVITDSEGEQWTVHEDGTVTEGGYAAEGGAPTSSNTNGIANNGDVTQISSKDVTVVFKPSGFYDTDALRDDITDEKFTKNYESIPQANGGDYNVLYKALGDISSNTTDVLTAEATFSNNKTKDDIVFKTKQGTAVAATWSGNTATIQLKRTFEFGKDEILATVKPKDSTAKYDVAGKVNVWHLQQKEINLTIVPIGNATVSSSIKDEINEIYNVAGVNFNITVAPSFSINQSDWDVENSNGKLDIGDSNTLANYTIEERAIFNKYKAQNSVNSQMYYMFVLGSDISTTDSSIDGFMPLKRQYGFAFNPSEKARTIAHELGHGIFGLKHPFIEYSIAQGSTDLLMDYGSGKQFTNMDWQKMHEPGLQLYWFQGDEDGESQQDNDILSHIKEKLSSLSESLDSKMISIVHCENCDEDNDGDENNNEEQNQNIEFYEIPNAQLEPLQEYNSILFNTPGLSLVKVEKIKKGKGICFSLYYSLDGDSENITTSLSQFIEGELSESSIEEQLIIIDHENNKEYTCTNELGKWSKVICEAIDNVNWSPTTTYITDLFNHIDACGDVQDGANTRIHNYSSESFDDASFINNLFSGENTISDSDDLRHSMKGQLFITDAQSLTDTVEDEINNYQLAEGEQKIWLHKNQEGLWEIKSEIPEQVNSFFEEIKDEVVAQGLQGGIDVDITFEDFFNTLKEGAQILGNTVDVLATGLYETFDWLGKGVRKARIPAYVWNCDHESYKPAFAMVYKYTTFVMMPITRILQEILFPVMAEQVSDAEIKRCILKFNEGEVELALISGLYNGLIEVVGSVPDLLKLVITPFSSKGRDNFSKFIDQLDQFKKENIQGELECEGTWCAIKTGLGEAFDPSKCCQFAELIGEIALPIIVAFVDPVALEAAVQTTAGRAILTIVKVIQWFDKIADPFVYLKNSLRFVNSSTSVIRSQAGKLLVRIENEIFKAKILVDDVIKNLDKPIQEVVMETADGIKYIVRYTENGASKSARILDNTLISVLENKGVNLSKLSKLLKDLDDIDAIVKRLDKVGLEDVNLNNFIDDLTNTPDLFDHFKNLDIAGTIIEDLGNTWKFLEGSPNIRRVLVNLESLKDVLDVKMYEVAGISLDNLRTGINNSSSKAKMIERLRDASKVDSGSSVEDFLDAFATAGREIDHRMITSISSLLDAFANINKSATTADFNSKWATRVAAATKQAKIVASELLAEARVDQIYKSKGWTRLDVDGVPPGKQGKFDRVYAEFDADGDLVNLHVVEAKGGGSTLGSRKIADGSVAQQGTKEYRDNIIDNLLGKLNSIDPLRKAIVNGQKDDVISYILVQQKVDVKSNFNVKKFPD